MKKKKNSNKLFFAIISVFVLILIAFVSFRLFDWFNNKETISLYDDKLKEVGYEKKSNTYYYGDTIRLAINQYPTHRSIELRDRLDNFDWNKNLDVYLRTVKVFIDFDYELISKGIEYVINNSLITESVASIDFNFSSYAISIYFFPKDNLSINITFNKYTTTDYKHYYASGIADKSFAFDKLVLKKIFNKDIPVEILSRMSENTLKDFEKNSIHNSFNIDDVEANISSYDKASLYISYSKYDYIDYRNIDFELTYDIKNFHDDIIKDLELMDRLFKTNSVQYKDKIIDLIENPNTDYHVSEKSNYSEKYYYGHFTIDSNFQVNIRLYENRVEIRYEFKEY